MPRDPGPEATGRPLTSSSLPTAAVSAASDPDPLSPTSKPASSSSRPSLLSRISLPLALPLRSRNRNVVDFHVRCDEPYRKYNAGDSVRGSVVLAVVRPLRITHLVVSLHGHVRVLKDPTSATKAQLAAALPGGTCARPQYRGNGLASLFQDEQVLSGEGRLEPGKYEFGFDLVFPVTELPSSIDFERGTISYMITATLTRPTTIAPTSSCDRRVMLTQKIDIGMLAPPRPRTIFLEPISKRVRRKRTTVVDKTPTANSEINDVASEPDSADRSIVTDDSGRDAQADHRSHIPSDVRSEVSGESARSVSTAVSKVDFAQLPQIGAAMSSAAKQQFVDDKTITATIELLRGGCLPGDTVSARVTVQHIKRVKSMTGVIVTLFRQGKIDTSPPPSRFAGMSKDEARKLDKEEMYPRSRTSLGGLSLSSTSSTSVFRKDLDQTAAPLIIDPATLQASVTISVKVPDDAFPTIKGVPGDMISFKYQVEVVVDLGGRLASQLQGGQSLSRFGPYGNGGSEQGPNSYGSRRSANIADTAQLRREKGVISVTMETVVGTADSSRSRKSAGKPPESRTIRIRESDADDDDEAIRPEMNEAPSGHFHANGQAPSGQSSQQPNDYQFTPPPGEPPRLPPEPLQLSRGPSHRQFAQTNDYHRDAAPSYIPAPQVANQGNMTEKERIREAETRLLPSQPPAASPSSADDDDIYDAEDTPRLPGSSPSAPADRDVVAGPSAPTEEQVSAGRPVEDKQELERLRLMNEASAPPEFPEDAEGRGGGSSPPDQAPEVEPSAPSLDVDGGDCNDSYLGHGAAAGPSRSGGSSQHPEQLPAYER
ncbi:pH-response regulator protein palF/RIM8 [Hirsutella rhossiliensis]|uniref:PH-response regulator protein palF/RIM8 n=1 Tax=Hirsutella rhossiliensis TaxID=111463 RepID=A0A9P8SME7_9HYPO|nr:pH-response regulator protein palF/RIM8 [Hirsutella rhossiliensis]KAH0967264.1 pH-response regulator protein palF/RIM8 [Hirsutella rhossiliensis]